MTKSNDIAVYPADEENFHDLYSAKCQCQPTVEIVGATLIYSHKKLWEVIKKDINNEKIRIDETD